MHIGNIGGQLLASAIFESSNEDSESDELSLLGLSLRLNPIKDEAASKIFKGLTFNKQIKLWVEIIIPAPEIKFCI